MPARLSLLLFNAGMNPLRAAPWADDLPSHMVATGMQIVWWLFAARCLTVVLGFRQKACAALPVEQPTAAPQRGLMAWLRQHASRRYQA